MCFGSGGQEQAEFEEMPVPTANPRVPYDTVFEDENILVVDKPRGRVTMPGRGHARDSLVNGVFSSHGAVLARLGDRRDYGLLHRLDRATSGLVVFARTVRAYEFLRDAFAEQRVEKSYLTIVRGKLPRRAGRVEIRLRQVRRGDLRVSVPDPRGLEARTSWKVLSSRGLRSLLHCQIETGRLHQIRAHLAALGCPVEGDTLYTGDGPDHRASVARAADRSLLLHAWKLGLPHPERRKLLRLQAPPPEHLRQAAGEWGLDLDTTP